MVVHDDSIVYERYFGGISELTRLPSFSISKTYAAVLIGCALKDGLISSLDDPLVKYVPDLASKSVASRTALPIWQRQHSAPVGSSARRLEGESVSHYFEQEVWGPLGAGQPATWSLDSRQSGVEKFAGGFNATARDYALLGLLYLHGGTLNGHVVLTKQWIERPLSPDPVAGQVQGSPFRIDDQQVVTIVLPHHFSYALQAVVTAT